MTCHACLTLAMRQSELVGTVAAAAAIGVSYRTMLRYIADGRLRPTVTLPSGTYRWDLDALRRQLAPPAEESADPAA
jgi:predicted site-specific integrase-resolvase